MNQSQQQEIKNKLWKFSPIPNIEESNFNKILERFYDMGVVGITRENTQNSMDGRLLGFDGPVVLTIKTGSIKKSDIPGIDEIIERILCLEGRNSYTKETINHMKSKISQEEVRYISFEDYNTRGLTGAKNGQSGSPKDTWGIYAYNKGVHFEESDSAVESHRGGSHGVGKIASNATSDINLMYFANCDEFGDKHLGGTVQLIEHVYEDQCYRSTGYFTDVEFFDEGKSKFYPYENHFHPVFEKNTRGLKIVIPFLRDEFDDEDEIIKSVCDSFFVSILQGKLEVIVNDERITRDTLSQYVKNPRYYNQDITEAKKEFTPLYVDTYLSQEPQELMVSDGVQEFHFKLYFRYDEDIPKGRVAVVRTIGMKIEDFKVSSNVNKPFNAVLIGNAEEDAYLKSLENESHTKLSPDHIKDPVLKRCAKRFINNLSKEIAKIIEEAIKEHNPVDGKIDTKDILYIMETQFKNDLSDSMGTVMITNGRPIVKAKTDVPKKEKRKKGEGGKQDPPKKKRDPLKRQKRQETDNTTEIEEQTRPKYSASPDIVERIILGNREILRFDFTQSDQITNETTCDISFSIIDGMGVEYSNEFKIRDNMSTVTDLNSGVNYDFTNNVIKDVRITNGVAELQMVLKESYNKSLKFVYYVEV